MTTLYIKTHNITKLKYFGKTTQDPFLYNGSGTYWVRHLKKHGNDVSTEIFAQFEDNDPKLVQTALKFSEENNIVNSKEWANLIPENGLSGGFTGRHSEETRKKISEKAKLRPKRIISEETKKKISESKLLQSEETRKKIGDAHRGKFVSEETRKKIGKSSKGRVFSKEAREKISKIAKLQLGKKKRRVQCPSCGLIGGVSNMKRYHFENCKIKLKGREDIIKHDK